MSDPFHFQPDLFNLLVEAIPRINKTKKDLLAFFKNVGAPVVLLNEYYVIVNSNPQQIGKKDITRRILEILNSNNSNEYLGIRRSLLQRVVDFTAFETCYPNAIDAAKARISEIKQLVQIKDSVTKQVQFIESERSEKIKEREHKAKLISQSKDRFELISNDFNKLFTISNPQQRGKELENVLNSLFSFYKISIKEAFCIADGDTGKIYEQIDGVVEINNYLTLIEMKWEQSPIGADKVGRFMGRLIGRHNVDGIIISYSSFTDTAIPTAKDGLAYKTIVLSNLQDIMEVIIQKKDLHAYFANLIRNTKLYNNPKPVVSISDLPDMDFSNYVSSPR